MSVAVCSQPTSRHGGAVRINSPRNSLAFCCSPYVSPDYSPGSARVVRLGRIQSRPCWISGSKFHNRTDRSCSRRKQHIGRAFSGADVSDSVQRHENTEVCTSENRWVPPEVVNLLALEIGALPKGSRYLGHIQSNGMLQGRQVGLTTTIRTGESIQTRMILLLERKEPSTQ
jgi:hypothetical protein